MPSSSRSRPRMPDRGPHDRPPKRPRRPHRARLLGLLPGLLVGGVLSAPATAKACSCVPPHITVSPASGSTVPTNTHVYLEFPPESAQPPWRLKDADVRRDEALVRLRRWSIDGGAARADRSDVVDVTRRVLEDAAEVVLELIPRAPLAPKARYLVELVPAVGGPMLLADITTDSGADTAPPAWTGVAAAQYHHKAAECCNCSTSDPWVRLTIQPATDDKSGAAQLHYAVWTLAPGAKPGAGIDYAAPPRTIVRGFKDKLVVGHASSCSPSNMKLPPDGGSLLLGVKVVDLAGNMSAPSEVTVDLTPKKAAAVAGTD